MAQNKDQVNSGQDGGPSEDPEGSSNLVRKDEWGSIADILKSIENTSRRSRAPPQGSHKRMPPLTENIQTTQAPGEMGQGMQQLDHLLRLMEQMCALRRQNNKLREHAQYLTAIKTLQDIRNEQLLHDCSCEVHRNVSDHSSSSSPMDHNLGNIESFSEPESHVGDDEIENKYRSNRLEKRVGRTIMREPKGRSVKKRSKSLDPFGEEAEEEMVKERGRPGIFSKFEKMKEKLTNRRGSVKRRSVVKGLDEDGKKFDSELGVPTDGIETKSEDSGFYQNLMDDSILQTAQRFELLQRGEEEMSDGEEVFDARQSALGQRTELRQVRKVSDVSTGSSSEDFHESKQKHKKYKSQPPSVPPSGSSLSDHNEDLHRARRKSRFNKSSSFQEFNSSVDTDPSPSTLPDPVPSKRHARLEQSLSMDTEVPEVTGKLGSQSPKMGSVDSKLGQKRKYSGKQPVLDLSDPSLSSSPESRGGDHLPRSSSPPEKKRNKETKGAVEAGTKKVPSTDMMTMYENIQANLSEDFLSKLEAWDKKKQKGGSGQDMTKQSSVESVSSEPGAIPTNDQAAELLQGLSEEFSKKLAEWDKKKKGTVGPSPKGDRKQKSSSKDKKEKGKKEDKDHSGQKKGEGEKLVGSSRKVVVIENEEGLVKLEGASKDFEEKYREWERMHRAPDGQKKKEKEEPEGGPPQNPYPLPAFQNISDSNASLATPVIVEPKVIVKPEQTKHEMASQADFPEEVIEQEVESKNEGDPSVVDEPISTLERKNSLLAEKLKQKDVNLKVVQSELQVVQEQLEKMAGWKGVSTSSLPGKLEAQVQTIQEEETIKDQTTSNTTEELTRSLQQRENLIKFLQLEVERQRREINFLRSDGSGGTHFKRAKSFSARDRNFDAKAMQVMDVPLGKSLASRGKKDSPNSTPSLSNADSSDQRNRESLSITTESTQSLETLHISAEDIRIDDLSSHSLEQDQKVEEAAPAPAPPTPPTKDSAVVSEVPKAKPDDAGKRNDVPLQQREKDKDEVRDVSEKNKESLSKIEVESRVEKESKPKEDTKTKEDIRHNQDVTPTKHPVHKKDTKPKEDTVPKKDTKPKEDTVTEKDTKHKEDTIPKQDTKHKEDTKLVKEKEVSTVDAEKTNSDKSPRGKQHPLDIAIPSSTVAQKISSLKEKTSSASDSDSKDDKTGGRKAKIEPKLKETKRIEDTKSSKLSDSSIGGIEEGSRRSRPRFRDRERKTSSDESSGHKTEKTSEEVGKTLKDIRSNLKQVQAIDKKPPLPCSVSKSAKDKKSQAECVVESDHDTSLKSDSEIRKAFDAASSKRRDSSDSLSSSRRSSPATRLIEKYDPSFAKSLAANKVEVNTVEDLKAKFSGGSQSAGSKSEEEDCYRARREKPKTGSVKMLSQAFAVTSLVNKEEGASGKGSGTAASSVRSTPSSISPASSCSSLSSSHVSDRIKRLQDRRVQSLKDKGDEKRPSEETKPPSSPKGKDLPKIQMPLLPNKTGYRSSLPNLTAVKAKFEQTDSGDDKTKSGSTPLRVRQKSGSTGKLSFTVSVTETKTETKAETETNPEVKPIRVRARPPRLVAVIETPGKDKNATETVTVRLRSPTARRSTRTNSNLNNSNKKVNELHISEPEIRTESHAVSATVAEDISASAPSLRVTSPEQKSISDQVQKPDQKLKTSQERESKILSSSDPQIRGNEKETSADSKDDKWKGGKTQSVGQIQTDQNLDEQGPENSRKKSSVTDGEKVPKEEAGTSLMKENEKDKDKAKCEDVKDTRKPESESISSVGEGSSQKNTESKGKTSGQATGNQGKKASKGGGKDSKGKKGAACGPQRGEQKSRKSKNGQSETTASQSGERKDGKSKSKRKGNKRAEQRTEQEANSRNSLDSEKHLKSNDSEGSRSSLNGDNFPDLLAETPKVRDSVIIDDNGNKTRNPRQAVAASALQGAAAAIGHALPDPATTAEFDEPQGDERRSRKDKTRRGRMLSKADRLSKLDLFRRARSVDTSKAPRDRSPSLERPGRSGRASSVDRSKKRDKSPTGVKGKGKDKDGQRGGWKRILRASNESLIDSVESVSDCDAHTDTGSITTASGDNLTDSGSVTNLHDNTSEACDFTNGVNVVGSSIFYC